MGRGGEGLEVESFEGLRPLVFGWFRSTEFVCIVASSGAPLPKMRAIFQLADSASTHVLSSFILVLDSTDLPLT